MTHLHRLDIFKSITCFPTLLCFRTRRSPKGWKQKNRVSLRPSGKISVNKEDGTQTWHVTANFTAKRSWTWSTLHPLAKWSSVHFKPIHMTHAGSGSVSKNAPYILEPVGRCQWGFYTKLSGTVANMFQHERSPDTCTTNCKPSLNYSI